MFKRKKTSSLLFAQTKPRAFVSENFRMLRTNIFHSLKDHSHGSILITSAGPEEGKSTIVANLGVVMAQAGKNVLVIDSDLRNPTMHKFFAMENNRGLTNLLVQKDCYLSDIVRNTLIQGLSLVTSGPIPPNPSELLGSPTMEDLLKKATAHYDTVLLDVPPIISVADAVVLAPLVDSVLLVVKSEFTVVDKIKLAKRQLEMVGANILGVVLNEVKLDKDDYRYYQYYSEWDNINDSGALPLVAASKDE